MVPEGTIFFLERWSRMRRYWAENWMKWGSDPWGAWRSKAFRQRGKQVPGPWGRKELGTFEDQQEGQLEQWNRVNGGETGWWDFGTIGIETHREKEKEMGKHGRQAVIDSQERLRQKERSKWHWLQFIKGNFYDLFHYWFTYIRIHMYTLIAENFKYKSEQKSILIVITV